MNFKYIVLSSILLSSPALSSISFELTGGRRQSSFDTGRDSGTHYSNESRFHVDYSLQDYLEVPVSIGLSATGQKYDRFKGVTGLETDAIHNDLAFDLRFQTAKLGPLSPFVNLRHTILSQGERSFDRKVSDTGYDVKGVEEFTVKGADITLGAKFPLFSKLEGLFAFEVGSKMINIEKTDVKEYRINLAGGPDSLEDYGKSKEGSLAYNSVAMMFGISATL